MKSQKLRLINVLASTKEFVVRSQAEGWTCEDLKTVAQDLDQMISHIFKPDEHKLPDDCLALYLPTGAIQEIAISNGWHNAYMELATEFDQVIHILNNIPSRVSD